jgi:predicted nucleotidyltransferase
MKIETLLSVIEVLGRNIFEGFNINQIARLSGVGSATTYRTLKEMESRNEVLKERKGNNLFYCLNLKNSSTVKYCELAEIEKRKGVFQKVPGLLSEIQALSKVSESVVLFGSLAREEKKPKDIDLLLLFQKKPDIKEIKKIIKKTKISPIYMNFSEFKDKIKERNPVVMDILKDAIVLHGEGIYWKLIKEI